MNDSKLYTTARLSPLSLTYYACCLVNGDYTVTLHFAEIIFRDNRSYQSLGRGVFDVYIQGLLLDGTVIAVKQLSSKSKQGIREFVNEIGMISEGKQLLLVYEYMENNCLAHSLFEVAGRIEAEPAPGREERPRDRGDLVGRAGVRLGGAVLVAQALRLEVLRRGSGRAGLPERAEPPQLPVGARLAAVGDRHGGPVKNKTASLGRTTNVLFDINLNAMISDFGLAKLDEEENTHISTRVAGIIGYMAPEYALWGYLTYKADVYSFGVVALEIVARMNNVKYRLGEEYVWLLAFVLQRKGSLMELMDPKLGSNFNQKEAMRVVKIALLCTNPSPALRPTMSAVLGMLQGHISVQEVNIDPSIYGDDLMLQSVRDNYNAMRSENSTEAETLLQSSDAAPNDSSSTSAHAKTTTTAITSHLHMPLNRHGINIGHRGGSQIR
ncbi:hypothetical protein RJ640_023904 [Escallonia rubra]|uniref:non-specific serine/threonine protein kinase n=1 Tax=Escallonia rubra TaxID=112253 RepID=A0AA88QJI4_9ASTE|nr:hypothetical protein RJ640_023904 [Escallonia rubra]